MINNLSIQKYLTRYDIVIGLVVSSLLINLLGLCFPLSLLQIYDRIIPNKSTDTLLILMSTLIVIVIFEAGLKIARAYISTWGDAKLNFDLGEQIFTHSLNSNLLEINKKGIGQHIEEINSLDSLKQLIGGQTIINLIDIPFMFLYLGVIAYISPKIASLVFFIQASLAIYLYFHSKSFRENLKLQSIHKENKTNFLIESLSNIHTIKSLGMENMHIRKFEDMSKKMSVDDLDAYLQNNSLVRAMTIASQLNVVAVVAFGATLIMIGELSIGALAGCTLLSIRAIQPLSQVIGLWKKYQIFNLAKVKYSSIMDLEQTSRAKPLLLPKINGKISLHNLSFKYNEDDQWLLDNLDLDIFPGQTIAISKGKGKTTLLSLLAGIIRPITGSVIIDDQYPLNQYDSNSYRKQVAFIPQDGKLFEGSILDNLTGFAPNPPLGMLRQVIEELGIFKTLTTMKDGLQTQVGHTIESNVSRGFKQQLLIARALITKPKIIFFDEANTSLDANAMKYLASYFKKIKRSTTLIMVTSEKQLLDLADKTFTLNGKLNDET